MGKEKDIECRHCGGTNPPGSAYCWYCGARLPRLRLSLRGASLPVRLGVQAFKWVIALLVVAGIAYGLYHAAERYLLPVFKEEQEEFQVVSTTATTRPPSPTTTTLPRTERVLPAGADRYSTAITISRLAFPEGAPGLVLVPGDNYQQAMCSVPLAAAYAGPLLYLPPTGLRTDIKNEIKRLNPTQVFLINVNRSKTVATEIGELLEKPTVTRLTGNDAYDTAVLIAQKLAEKVDTIAKAVIVPSDSFVEAAAVSPLAGARHWPILLTRRDSDPPSATVQALKDLKIASALVVGTRTKVELVEVDTQIGATSHQTAALVAEYAADNGLDFAHTCLASGDEFPDPLAAAAYLALERGILLLAREGELPADTLTVFNAHAAEIRLLDIIALPALAKELGASGE